MDLPIRKNEDRSGRTTYGNFLAEEARLGQSVACCYFPSFLCSTFSALVVQASHVGPFQSEVACSNGTWLGSACFEFNLLGMDGGSVSPLVSLAWHTLLGLV